MKSKRSSPKLLNNSSNLLSNKYVLYASFFFAIVTAANYLLRNNLEAVAIFVIIGFLTTYFSKNMIVVLLTTTILTNFIVMFKNRRNSMMMEGFTQEEISILKTKMDDAKAAMDKEKDDTKKAALKVTYEAAKKSHDEAVATADADASAKESAAAKSVSTTGSNNTIAMGTQPANDVKQPLKNKSAIKDGMSQLSPASVNAESVDPMMQIKVPGMATGYNAQKEQAYNTLASVGGGQGGDMLSQQTEMINNLKSIEPILNTAQNFLDKFENSSISKMFSGSGGFPGMSLLTGGGASASNKATPAAV